MQAFQYWKTAMPVLTSRITQNVQPQIRTISRSLSSGQQTLSSRTYSSFNSSIFSSVSATRPTLSKLNTNTYILSPAMINQIRAFSASASLAGKRATYNPSRRVQKRRHGFLTRLRTRTGRMILKRRRLKGRKDLSW